MASTDKPEDNKSFAEKNEASFPILSDPTKEMCESYGVLATWGFAQRERQIKFPRTRGP